MQEHNMVSSNGIHSNKSVKLNKIELFSFKKMGLNIFVYVQESERKNIKYSFNIIWSTPNIPWKDWCWTEAPVFWPPDVKRWFIGKDPDAGKDWGQEEKGVTKDEMVGWCHWLNWHEFEQALGDNEGQGSLVCCSPWGYKELDMT